MMTTNSNATPSAPSPGSLSTSSDADLQKFKEGLVKSSMPLIYFILLQSYIVYTLRDRINIYFGIGMIIAFILIYLGIRRNNMVAPIIGSILIGADIILTTFNLFVASQLPGMNIGALFFAYGVKIGMLYFFIKVIRMQRDFRDLKSSLN